MFDLLKKAVTRRTMLKGTAGACVTTTLVGCQKSAPKVASKLAIIHTNDTHGHDILNDESLGMAAVKQLKTDYEAKGYEVLVLDAGDATQGENVVTVSQGDNAIDFMNLVGYDAMTLGNHEFDYGQGKILDYIAAANFPILSANIIADATGETMVEANTTFTLTDGTKVGVFGITTPETYTKVSPLVIRGLTIYQGEELYACAQKQADALRADGCSLVVCLAHLGEDDSSAPNRAMDLVANTSGIDLVIDGHDHEEEDQLLANAEGKDTLVVETGCYTHAIGVVTWEDGKLTSLLEHFGSYEGQDPEVAEYIKNVCDDVDDTLSDVIATVAFDLDGNREPGVRTQETNLGDLVADAMMWQAQQIADDMPDAALINGGSIRQSIPAGEITMGRVIDVLPFLNYLTTVKVTGKQLLEALEASCSAAPGALGAFPHVCGIKFTLDLSVPYEAGETYPNSTYKAPAKPGSRVTITEVGGQSFDLNKTYTIASNNFICTGGDTYYVFAEAAEKTMQSFDYVVYDVLANYLKLAQNSVVSEEYAKSQGRITILDASQEESLAQAA